VDIILIGASKKASLVLGFLHDEGSADRVIGFVDQNPVLWDTTIASKPVLGDLESALEKYLHSSVAFCICLSERFFADRSAILTRLSQSRFASASLISKNAYVSSSARVAEGSILFPDARVGVKASVGSCVTLYTGALVEHDCVVSDNVEIASRAVLAGGVKVKSNAFIGINATVLPNVVIGCGAIIGGGAVVTKDVSEQAVVAGNPARVLHAQTR
jgi:sugar O-acyltransferase (sialic acid O-acetyltransferase NeuD family)